jgi:hypothetical protein
MNNNKRLGHFPSKAPSYKGEAIPCSRCDEDIVFYAGMNQSYYVSNDGAMSPYCEALLIRDLITSL